MDKPTEYAALNFDGTERRANYRTVAYRIDILHLCERKDAAAILYEIIYRWQTEVRKPEIVKEIERRKKANLPTMTEDEVKNMMWVWMSYNDFVRESGGAVAYNTVIRMLDYLVENVKIVECRENHDPRYPDYEYRIRLDTVKSKLKALPATPAFLPKVPKKKGSKGEESTQVGTVEKRSTQKGRRAQRSTQVGTVSTQNGIATTQKGIGVYPNGGTSHTTTHTSHIEHTESTYSAPEQQPAASGAIAPTPAPVSSQDHTLENTAYQPEKPLPVLSQFFEDAIAGAQRNGASPIVTTTMEDTNEYPNNGRGDRDNRTDHTDDSGTAVEHGHADARDDRPDHGSTRASQQTTTAVAPAASGYQKPQQQTLAGVSQQGSAHVEPKAEQDVLIERPAVPEMPLQSARWPCAETAVLVSEALRGKYYTDNQRKNQQSAATRMFRDFKGITRPQFEEIFKDWVKWWKDHDKGFFTLAGLLARGKDGEVRLQTALDRIEARELKTRKPSGPIASVPKDPGTVLWYDNTGAQRMMTYAEADENGWNGGFGEFIQHTQYGRAAV